jgi:hypothetical protein
LFIQKKGINLSFSINLNHEKMTTQQFWKGLFMAIASVVVTAFGTTPFSFALILVAFIAAVFPYLGKNLINVLHSNSQPGQLTLINFISGILIAIGAGITDAAGILIVNHVMIWPLFWKTLASIVFTYAGSTFFAPPDSQSPPLKYMFSKKYKSRFVGSAGPLNNKTMMTILIISLSCIGLGANAQGLLKPVPLFPVKQTVDKVTNLNVQVVSTSGAWYWELDGAVDLAEINYNTLLKELVPSGVHTIGIGPCIGYQHYVPTSTMDPTPKNNYGFAGGVLLGNRFKIVLQANIWQYLKGGITITPNPAANIFPVGFFIGTGITF